MKMIITVSGLAGSGKTTISKLLAERLGLKHFCVGTILREMAAKNNMGIEDFEKELAEKDSRYDKEIDAKQREVASEGDVVMDSRLGGWLIKEADFKVWLEGSLSTRAERSAKRDNNSPEENMKLVKERDKSDIRRYKEYYKIDLNDKSVYDLVIDTSELSPEEIVDKIIAKIEGD